MRGIPSQLLRSLREVLSNCEQFETNRALRDLFADKRIAPWRNNLPQADTLMGRVESVLSYLYDKKHRDGANALVLMLLVLVDAVDSEDVRYEQLKTLVSGLEAELKEGTSELARTQASEAKIRDLTSSPTEEMSKPRMKAKTNSSVVIETKDSAGLDKFDFFISYNRNDKPWAEWIAWQLENAGYTTIIQAWDFRPGGNFVADMQKAMSNTERTIAVLSRDYLNSKFTQPEWNAAFARDPTGEKGLLLPVKVRDCELTGLLPQIVYIDLIDLSPNEAAEALLNGVKRGRAKPSSSPSFPGIVRRPKPIFPG
jgi:hypothetical protein